MSQVITLLIASIAIGVPLYGMVVKNHTLLMWWLCATIGLDILTFRLVGNFMTIEMFGLLYLPNAIVVFSRLGGTRTGKLLFTYLSLLVMLVVFFGFVLPWPDSTGSRPWIQQSSGRSLSQLLLTACLISASSYVANQVQRGFRPERIIRYFIHGTLILSIGIGLQAITGIDLFGSVVPEYASPGLERLRGFAGEPKYAGQLISIGLICLLVTSGPIKNRHWIVTAHLMAQALTVSTSSILMLVSGIGVVFILSQRGRGRIAPVVAGGLVALAGLRSLLPKYWDQWIDNLTFRLLEGDDFGSKPIGFSETVASRLEVFDASAFLFLWDNPFYSLIGVGPGLVSIPASAYIPSGYARLSFGDRIDMPPNMGFFWLIASGGVILLIIALNLIISCWRDLSKLAGQSSQTEAMQWNDSARVLAVVSVLYLLQVNEAVFIFVGIGWGAGAILHEFPFSIGPSHDPSGPHRRRVANANCSEVKAALKMLR